MTLPDLAPLLDPVSGAHPCGRDLELSLELQALESAAKEPEQPAIASVSAVDSRNWRALADQARKLLAASKDLRIAVLLTRALSQTDGIAGYAHGLALVRGLLERHWDGLYPSLDEDDDSPDLRINALSELLNREQLVALRHAPIAASAELGTFDVNAVLAAHGLSLAQPTRAEVTPKHVLHAVEQLDDTALTALVSAIELARGDLHAIASWLTTKVGAHRFHPDALAAREGERSPGLLDALSTVLNELLRRRHPERDGASAEVPEPSEEGGELPASPAVAAPRPDFSGEVRSRDDVLKAIENICKYYARHEPASPVPILLARAKRLVPMSFVELIQELADQALPQVEALSGSKPAL